MHVLCSEQVRSTNLNTGSTTEPGTAPALVHSDFQKTSQVIHSPISGFSFLAPTGSQAPIAEDGQAAWLDTLAEDAKVERLRRPRWLALRALLGLAGT